MNIRRLALSNVRGNWHQYSAFFWSSVFSVMIFFVYAAFIFHPEVVHGDIQGGKGVRSGLIICEFIIIVFSFFFVLYSISAFLKSRKKEFGLLTLFGMTTGQIKRIVLYENLLISTLAIAAGIGFGLLFSKLFFMAVSAMLGGKDMSFVISVHAILMTVGGFFLLFLSITWVTLTGVGRSEIVELLTAAKKPKTVPAFSKRLGLLSLLCLAGGYALALHTDGSNALITMGPTVLLVMIGTYFLFTQSSVAVLRRLQQKPSFFYRGISLITVSQLIFKIKDNARLLFMVTILSTVMLAASGTFNSLYQGNYVQMMDTVPQAIGLLEKGSGGHDPAVVKEILQRNGAVLDYELHVTGGESQVKLGKLAESLPLLMIAESAYNEAAGHLQGREPLQIESGHAVFLYPYRGMKVDVVEPGERIEAGGESLILDKQVSGSVMTTQAQSTYLLILDDEEHQKMMANLPPGKLYTIHGYELKEWESAEEAVKQVEARVGKDGLLNSRIESYLLMKQMSSLTLFIGIFVSFLFFLAAGSMIYFKLFTELPEDQAQFNALTKIGMTVREVSRIVSIQIGLLFFLPCLVGIVHMLFAMHALSNILAAEIWQYALAVILIFIVMQSLYYLAARRAFMKRILQAAVR